MSYKTKRLIIISLAIIILAISANEGNKGSTLNIDRVNIESKYPDIPDDINPDIIITKPNIEIIPKPTVQKPVYPPGSQISAEAYLVANLDTGEVYAERDSLKVFPIASLTKLVTALIASHKIDKEKKITITQSMLDSYGDAGHLVLGENLTVRELIYPLLLESSNDAALALAESYGYEDFIREMNAFTREQGMNSTSFRDPSGLSSYNVSNTKDLFTLARYLYNNEKELLEISKERTITLSSTTEHGEHVFNTINPFPLDPHFIGGKTGRTKEAKESMISLFLYSDGTHSYPIAIIVLRSEIRFREIDSSLLLEKFIQKIDRI